MTRSKRNYKLKKLTKKELEKRIQTLFTKNPKKRFKPSRIAKKLQIKNSKDSITDVLKDLHGKGKIHKIIDDLYQLSNGISNQYHEEEKNILTGRLDVIKSGAAYLLTGSKESDVYIPKKHLKTALHDDEVTVEVYQRRNAKKPEGKVINIVSRAHKKFLGTYDRIGLQGIVDVMFRSRHYQIQLVGSHTAKRGDKVIVKVVHYGNNGTIKGEIESILSSDNVHDLEMNTILINEGFDIAFSPDVLDAANKLDDKITEKDLQERRDIREVLTFTIDPADAKDFDDAISYRVLDNGEEEIGVHIADVSHFVKEDDIIDKEAYLRSTSVYLVDRVCPMLPERLSNELCSLRPKEDKFTFSAIFTFDRDDKITSRWFGKTLIHSNKRFTYEEAQLILSTGEGQFSKELKAVDRHSKSLRKKRYELGSIKFETDELRFNLDKESKPIDVYIKERKDTHLLVEDFMLLANKEVSTFISRKEKKSGNIPFVYRVHDSPDPEKLKDFALLALDFGLKFNLNTPKEIAASFNAITENQDNQEFLSILMPLAIRTMSKAEYSSENIGHYGLGFSHYSHFTSPIRRYADLLVHRILNRNLLKDYRVNGPKLEEKCKHISKQERKAISAERESIKFMQAVYMESRVGEVFDARISGIIEKGIFVETLESRAEGLIPFTQIGTLKAINTGGALVDTEYGEKEFKFGSHLKVYLDKVDVQKRLLDFSIDAD